MVVTHVGADGTLSFTHAVRDARELVSTGRALQTPFGPANLSTLRAEDGGGRSWLWTGMVYTKRDGWTSCHGWLRESDSHLEAGAWVRLGQPA